MRTIYLDKDFKCHVADSDQTYLEIQTDYFDGKDDYFVESHVYIPDGYSKDGQYGKLVYKWREVPEDPIVEESSVAPGVSNAQSYSTAKTLCIADLNVEGAKININWQKLFASGEVGAILSAEFDEHWTGLNIFASFIAGDERFDEQVTDPKVIVVPDRILMNPYKMFELGFCGYSADKKVITTVMTTLGRIPRGAMCNGENPNDPRHSRFEELEMHLGDLSDLKTHEKESLVGAMNEIAIKSNAQYGVEVDKWLDAHPEATTTVQDGSIERKKLSPSLDDLIFGGYATPEMFGAKGDGVTDDTDAVVSAIKNAPVVRIDKTYICKKILVKNLTDRLIFGPGTLKFSGGLSSEDDYGYKFLCFEGCKNLNIQGLTVDANQPWLDSSKVYSSRPLHSEPNHQTFLKNLHKTAVALAINNCENVKISAASFLNSCRGLQIDASKNVLVYSVSVINTWSDGIAVIWGSRNVQVHNCYLEMVNDDQCSALGYSDNPLENPDGVLFSGCVSHNCWGALACFEGSKNCIIQNSYSDNCNLIPFKAGSMAADADPLKRWVPGDNQHFIRCTVKMAERVEQYNDDVNTRMVSSPASYTDAHIFFTGCKVDGTAMKKITIANCDIYNTSFEDCTFLNMPLVINAIKQLSFKNSNFKSNKKIGSRLLTINSAKSDIEILSCVFNDYDNSTNTVAIGEEVNRIVLLSTELTGSDNKKHGLAHFGRIGRVYTDDPTFNIADVLKVDPQGCIFRVSTGQKIMFPVGTLVYNFETKSIEEI